MTSAFFSKVPELFFNIKVYFPPSLRTARRIVKSVFFSYLSIVILRKKIYNILYTRLRTQVIFFRQKEKNNLSPSCLISVSFSFQITSGSGSPPYFISYLITCPFLTIIFFKSSPMTHGLTVKTNAIKKKI